MDYGTVICEYVYAKERGYSLMMEWHVNGVGSRCEYAIEILFRQFGLADYKLGEFLENLVELDVVLVLGEILIVAEQVPEFALAVQQLVEVAQEQLQLADVAALLVLPDALHEDLVHGLEPGDEVPVHVLHLRVVGQQLRQVGVRVQVVVVPHQVLRQEDAGVEAAAHLGVDLLRVVHQFLQLLRQRDHALRQRRQQSLHQVQVLVQLPSLDHHRLPLQVVERHLEVDLLELVHEPLRLPLLVQLHQSVINRTHPPPHQPHPSPPSTLCLPNCPFLKYH